jgi:hypothetical protein
MSFNPKNPLFSFDALHMFVRHVEINDGIPRFLNQTPYRHLQEELKDVVRTKPESGGSFGWSSSPLLMACMHQKGVFSLH